MKFLLLVPGLLFAALGGLCLYATATYQHVAPAVPGVGVIWSIAGIVVFGLGIWAVLYPETVR